ncbi:N-formimino-L-glutamate deiminase [Skermanella stibiiresistens SB22]|uniref:N-formimino-L-glutamate deiminase n=1 Tax=Skermanella stibiiresistens SB22 TaxID=1385369 RepID=W9H4F7_9PROT|nr:formimidoylglutamate deiminase [Skermanella stibiiresistens]EWY40949.1 N-formimino-L-glutamate deiminase [Skermanella stibiiresistens SB22]
MKFFAESALLAEGWSRNVVFDVDDAGLITKVKVDGTPDDAMKLGAVVVPGMANLHSHTFQRAMAGLAERRGDSADSFWTWRQTMYGFLDKLTPDDVQAIAALVCAEMLEAGFTTLGEFHYLHHDPAGAAYADIGEMTGRVAAAASSTGIALTLLPVFYAHGGFGGMAPTPGQRRFINDPDRYARLMESAGRHVKAVPNGRIGVAPHSLRAATVQEIGDILPLADGGPIHIHVAEQVKEVEDCVAWCGKRPVEYLLDSLPVDTRWCAIHATHMTPSETEALARSGAVAGLCPETEGNLGDGLFDAPRYLTAGGRFGIGSDSHIHIGLAEELRLLEYGQRLVLRSRNVLCEPGGWTGDVLFRRAVAGGAQALGQPTDSLRVGQRADFVTLDETHPSLAGRPPEQMVDAWIFAGDKSCVREVRVAGHPVVTEGRHKSRDPIRAAYAKVLTRING